MTRIIGLNYGVYGCAVFLVVMNIFIHQEELVATKKKKTNLIKRNANTDENTKHVN